MHTLFVFLVSWHRDSIFMHVKHWMQFRVHFNKNQIMQMLRKHISHELLLFLFSSCNHSVATITFSRLESFGLSSFSNFCYRKLI